MSTESPILPRVKKPGKRISIVLAVAVHLLLAGFLFYGVRWQTKATDVVEVDLVRAMPEPAVAPPPAPVAVPPAPTIEPPAPVAPPPKPDIVIMEKEKPKPPPPKPVVVKPKETPKTPPKVAPPLRADPFQEQLKREDERVAQRKQLDRAAQELNQMKTAQASSARDKATADWSKRIASKIRGNIAFPPRIEGNPELIFAITQLPSGEVLTVRLTHPSGNAALDIAAERAIWKSSPLPKPEQSDVFSRSFSLKWRPLDD